MRKCLRQGQFYAKQTQLRRFLSQKIKQNPKESRLIIVPHAGLDYCGSVYCSIFSTIDAEKYDRILLLGVAHSLIEGLICQTPFELFQNPLDNHRQIRITHIEGVNLISSELCQQESSLEMMIPGIAHVFGDRLRVMEIAAVYVPCRVTLDEQLILQQFTKLKRTLIICSSDFCHCGPAFNFIGHTDERTAQQTVDHLNEICVKSMLDGPYQFHKVACECNSTICGIHAIYCGLALLSHVISVNVEAKGNSGDVDDFTQSNISYLGIRVW